MLISFSVVRHLAFAVLTPTSSPAGNVTSASVTAAIDVANRENGILMNQEKTAGLSEAYMLSAPPGFERFSPLQLGFAVRKRNPCLGWIGPANDEDFILLKPATVLGRRTGDRPRKRKSRWDVGPNDVV